MRGASPLQQKLAWIFLGKHLLRDDKFQLRCSRCSTKMVKVKRQNTTIDKCPRCGGIFLDHGEINKLVKLSEKHGGKYGKEKKESR